MSVADWSELNVGHRTSTNQNLEHAQALEQTELSCCGVDQQLWAEVARARQSTGRVNVGVYNWSVFVLDRRNDA